MNYKVEIVQTIIEESGGLLRQIPNAPDQLKTILEEIIATSTGNDFITFEIKDVASIAVVKKYAGFGASVVARIKNTKMPFSIDFGVGDVIIPKQETRKRGIYLFSIINSLHFHSSPRIQYFSVVSRTISLKPTAL